MKFALLFAIGFAGALILIGARDMDRKDRSSDVAIAGALFITLGLALGGVTLVTAVVYLFAKV